MPTAPRRIDTHVHLIGDGSSGSKCWIQLRTWYHRLMGKALIHGCGLPQSSLNHNLDSLYVEQLANHVRSSRSLDAVVLLAQDLPHHDDGSPLPNKGAFFVPNDYLFEVCKQFPDLFIPAASIHPGRPDAIPALESAIAHGCKVIKLLPNCLNVDYSRSQFFPFWRLMAQHHMILLSHTGGEYSLPNINLSFADPKRLKPLLDLGLTVIAAHSAGRSGLWDPDYTDDLISMFDHWPHLYGDNSALSTPIRARTIKKLLDSPARDRIIHGSDYPISIGGFGPWRCGHITYSQWQSAKNEPNPLERDCFIKRACGFDDSHLLRMHGLLTQI